MSKVERYKGKLIKINKLYGEGLEHQCKRVLENLNPSFELRNYYYSYEEYLLDEYSEDYYIKDNEVYKIEKEQLDPEFDIFEGRKNINDTIDFHVMYYNGGCCLSEALDEVMKDLDK